MNMICKCVVCLEVFACYQTGQKVLCTHCPNEGTDCLGGAMDITSGYCGRCLDIVLKHKRQERKDRGIE